MDALDADAAGVDKLVKKGPGTLILSGAVGANANFAALDVREGEVQIASAADKFYPDVHVCSGAVALVSTTTGPLRAKTLVSVDAGGLMDFGGHSDTIDGLVGAGIVSNYAANTWSGVAVTMKLTRGPHRFSGQAFGRGDFVIDQSSSNPDYALVVAASNAFKNARLKLGAYASTNLLFAAGIGSVGGALIIGNHSAAYALDPSHLAGIRVMKVEGSKHCLAVKHRGLPPTVYPCPIIVRDNASVTFWNDTILEQPDIFTGYSQFTWYSNLTVRAGVVAGPKTFSGTGATNVVTVSGGVFAGDAANYTASFSPILYYRGTGFGATNLEMNVTGGQVVLGGDWTGTGALVPMKTTVTGGTLALNGQVKPPTGATAANPASLTVDGATLALRNGTYVNSLDDKKALVTEANRAALLVRVGAKGMKLDLDSETYSDSDSYNHFVIAGSIASAGDGTDGGIVRTGCGILNVWYPFAIKGPFSHLDGKVYIRDVASARVDEPFFGAGSFTLGNAWLAFYGTPTTTFTTRVATGTGATFKLAGAGLVRMRAGSSVAENLEVGPIAREKGGVLFLYDATTSSTSFTPANSGVFRVSGGLAAQASGSPLLKTPVVTAHYGVDSKYHVLDFAKYDATADAVTDFEAADYGSGLVADTVANVTGYTTVAADTEVSVKALRLASSDTWDQWGYSGKGLLTISAGARVKVGNGVDPALVILNNTLGRAALKGPGTLDFGASEGVFALNDFNASGDKNGIVACALAGSGGVTYTALASDSRNRNQVYEIRGENTYTGGTIVNAATVEPYSERSFSTGKIRVGDGEAFGGRIRLGTHLADGFTLTNDLELAGWGHFHGTRWYSSASHEHSYGALYVLSGAGTAGTGPIALHGATLVLEGASKMSVTNRLSGLGGMVRLADRQLRRVQFCDAADAHSTITLDLCGRNRTVNSVKGFSSITNSGDRAAVLSVLDDAKGSYAGAIDPSVTLHYGSVYTKGCRVILR